MHSDESISTMKFADRAMKVQVNAMANEINPEDDKLVQKLRREVIHLRELLQMRRNKTEQDVHVELLNLKEENFKLKAMNSASEEVEKLKRENNRLRLIIQDNQQMLQTQNAITMGDVLDKEVHEDQEHNNFKSATSPNDSKDFGRKSEAFYNDTQEIRSIMDKENDQREINREKESNFFITETESEKQMETVKKKAIKPPLPSIMDVLTDSKARETILSTTNKKGQNDTSMKKPKPMMLTNTSHNDPNVFGNQNESHPAYMFKDFSRLSYLTDDGVKTRVTREMGLNEIHSAAQNLKEGMVSQNRCHICTLKLPCKHYETAEEMLENMPVKKENSVVCPPVDYSAIPPLPRIHSTGLPKRNTLPPTTESNSKERQVLTEKDSSFNSNFMCKEQISMFRDSMKEPRRSEPTKTAPSFTRVDPRDTSMCTIRIRSKNNIETFKGNVKRTISEHRANRTQTQKLKEAQKRLKTLEKIEEYRRQKMQEELKQLELQNLMFEEHKKIEMERERKQKKYLEMRKRQLAEAQEQKLKQLKKEEKKRKKEEVSQKKKEQKKKQYYDEQKLKLNCYKKKLEEHIEKMSIPALEGMYNMRNSDIVIAREDLASIPEHHMDSHNESVSNPPERAGSVLDRHINRKPAVS